ncbi:hypothetical protein [Planotetraspora sp. GP83]|uniref:hypothetical protein n=1 Tax=Planotetraspora sp. GP83 TaxID=3156264 RepID=UPI003519AE3B
MSVIRRLLALTVGTATVGTVLVGPAAAAHASVTRTGVADAQVCINDKAFSTTPKCFAYHMEQTFTAKGQSSDRILSFATFGRLTAEFTVRMREGQDDNFYIGLSKKRLVLNANGQVLNSRLPRPAVVVTPFTSTYTDSMSDEKFVLGKPQAFATISIQAHLL